MNEAKGIKVPVFLEHHQGENMWTAMVPLIDGCIAEGRNEEEATRKVQLVLAEFLAEDPSWWVIISQPVKFLLTEIEVSPPGASNSQ